MTIYLDYVFIENLLIDYILLKETSYISRKETTNKRNMLSAMIASSYVVIMMLFKVKELNYLICKALLVLIMIYISFKPKELNEYIKLIATFFLISAINIGTLTMIINLLSLRNINGWLKMIVYLFSLLSSKFFANHMWKIYKQNIKGKNLVYEVKIHIQGEEYKYKGFLDTGNTVFSYTHNIPVLFAEILDEDMLEELKKKEFIFINTITLSNKQEKKAYVFDDIEIIKDKRSWQVKAAIVFEKVKLSKDNTYNMLLNYNLYVDKMGGINI